MFGRNRPEAVDRVEMLIAQPFLDDLAAQLPADGINGLAILRDRGALEIHHPRRQSERTVGIGCPVRHILKRPDLRPTLVHRLEDVIFAVRRPGTTACGSGIPVRQDGIGLVALERVLPDTGGDMIKVKRETDALSVRREPQPVEGYGVSGEDLARLTHVCVGNIEIGLLAAEGYPGAVR